MVEAFIVGLVGAGGIGCLWLLMAAWVIGAASWAAWVIGAAWVIDGCLGNRGILECPWSASACLGYPPECSGIDPLVVVKSNICLGVPHLVPFARGCPTKQD